MDALKDLLAAHKDAAHEHKMLGSLLATNLPFLINVFRYYQQGMQSTWNQSSQLQSTTGSGVNEERIVMCCALLAQPPTPLIPVHA
jgi:hypothetical protein